MKLAISTGGGDAPGLNAVIRGVVLAAVHRGWECFGIRRGYGGLLGEDRVVELDVAAVRGITHLGGTILGTTNRGDPFAWRERRPDGEWVERDRSDELVTAFRALDLDALVAIGGDGSLRIAQRLLAKGLPVVGVPKTIDNDVGGTVAAGARRPSTGCSPCASVPRPCASWPKGASDTWSRCALRRPTGCRSRKRSPRRNGCRSTRTRSPRPATSASTSASSPLGVASDPLRGQAGSSGPFGRPA